MKKPKTRRLKFWPAMLSAVAVGGLASAQTNSVAPTDVNNDYLKQLLQRLDQQEAEIKDLKSKVATTSNQIEDQIGAASSAPKYPNLQFHGFADLDYQASTRQGIPNASGVNYLPQASHGGDSFYEGELDLYMQSQLAEDLSALSETSVSSAVTSGNGSPGRAGYPGNNACQIDIERLELSWKPSEYFNVDVGRFHTTLGYYNTAYHHGTWFQNAVGRPFFLEFEDSGGLLPVHTVGISMHGAIPSGSLNLSYFLEVGNGEQYNNAGNNPVQNEVDGNFDKAVNFGFFAKPDWLPGVQFGVGAYHDTQSPLLVNASNVQVPVPNTDEWIWNASCVYHSSLWELLSEGYLVRHEEPGATAHYTPMYYVQASRKFGIITPYARFTYVNGSEDDIIYTQILTQGGRDYGPSLGIRYDFATYVALKAQYDYVVQTGYSSANELTLQAAFAF